MPDRPQHVRTQSQGRKLLPPHARPSKAPPLRRGTSYNHSNPHSHGQHHHSHSKSGSGCGKKAGGGEEEAQHIEDEESGMASFLQFWYVHVHTTWHGRTALAMLSRAWLTVDQCYLREADLHAWFEYTVLLGSVSLEQISLFLLSLTW